MYTTPKNQGTSNYFTVTHTVTQSTIFFFFIKHTLHLLFCWQIYLYLIILADQWHGIDHNYLECKIGNLVKQEINRHNILLSSREYWLYWIIYVVYSCPPALLQTTWHAQDEDVQGFLGDECINSITKVMHHRLEKLIPIYLASYGASPKQWSNPCITLDKCQPTPSQNLSHNCHVQWCCS